MDEIEYLWGGVELLDAVGPLWTKLNQFHSQVSLHFGSVIAERTFRDRKNGLIAKSRSARLRVDVARRRDSATVIGYCVASVDASRTGEIDSLFVEEAYRRHGVGGRLMQAAVAWMDEMGAVEKRVVVTSGNEDVWNFYAKFGFYLRRYELRQKPKEPCA
jgi:diamine N-acetyltransferase